MTDSVLIRELAPREGFQILSNVVPTAKKLELIRALVRARVPEIEVTSFVRPDRVPQLADCEDVVRELGEPPTGTVYRALCLNGKGYSRSLAFKNLDHGAWLYTGASDTFLQKNANTSFDQQLASIRSEWSALWTGQGITEVRVMISNAFGCFYEGEIECARIVERWSRIKTELASHQFTAIELSLADTVGYGTASHTEKLIKALRANGVPSLSLHLHDTKGHALECIEVGLRHGIRIFESSVAGLGGCPFTPGAAGNVATEKVVDLVTRLGFSSGIDREQLAQASKVALELT